VARAESHLEGVDCENARAWDSEGRALNVSVSGVKHHKHLFGLLKTVEIGEVRFTAAESEPIHAAELLNELRIYCESLARIGQPVDLKWTATATLPELVQFYLQYAIK
jgi:hypothetical protein